MKEETSAAKATMQFLVITFLTVCVMCFGGYGLKLAINEQTTEAWQLWGAFLFTVIIIFPAAGFWSKQIYKLFNIED
jgi:hypothetical protein